MFLRPSCGRFLFPRRIFYALIERFFFEHARRQRRHFSPGGFPQGCCKVAASLAADHSCVSAVGHADTAAVFAHVLGVPVACNRATVALKDGDVALVGQYSGPRLPEGATTLPEGATIKWVVVGVNASLVVEL